MFVVKFIKVFYKNFKFEMIGFEIFYIDLIIFKYGIYIEFFIKNILSEKIYLREKDRERYCLNLIL